MEIEESVYRKPVPGKVTVFCIPCSLIVRYIVRECRTNAINSIRSPIAYNVSQRRTRWITEKLSQISRHRLFITYILIRFFPTVFAEVSRRNAVLFFEYLGKVTGRGKAGSFTD